MPGFGSGPFGGGPFGRYDWARKVLWLDIPELPDRADDANDPLHPLENFQESVMPLFEEMLGFATDFEHLRDPDEVRTKFQDVITGLTITSSAVEETSRTARVIFDDPDPDDPLEPLRSTSIGWVLTDSNGEEFTVNQVHKLSSAVIIVGNVLPATGSATLRPVELISLLGADYGISVDQNNPEVYQRNEVRNAWQWLAVKGANLGYDIVAKLHGYRVTALPLYRINEAWAASISADHVFEIPESSGVYYTDENPTRARFDEVAADVIPTDVLCWEDRGDGVTYGEQIGESMQGLAIDSTTDLGDGVWQITIGPDTGAGDEIIGSAPDMTLEDLAAPFSPSMVGRDLVLVGATTSDNNGTFPITEYISPSRVKYTNPDGVAEVFGGTWSVNPRLDPIATSGFTDEGYLSPWYASFPGGDSGQFWLEGAVVDVGSGVYTFDVQAGDSPTFGSTVNIDYECKIISSCDFCRASALRLEVRPEEILTDPDALFGGALERMYAKLLKAVPIHVRVLEVAHVIGPLDADVHVSATHIVADFVSQQTSTQAFASVGYYYDIVEGDEVEVDTQHLVASPTQYTIP